MTTGRRPSGPPRSSASRLARPMSTRPLVGFAGVSRKSAATGPWARALPIGLLHRARPAFRRERDRRHAELRQDPCQQEVRAAVDGPRMNDDRARPRVGPERGRDGGHARGEDEVVLRLVPDRQPVLEHFEIGIVDPAVDQARLFVRPLLPQAVGQLEKRLAVLGGAEDEGGGGKDRRLERAFGPERVVAVAHHQRFGRERPVAETPASPSLARHASPSQTEPSAPRRVAGLAGLAIRDALGRRSRPS